MTRLGVVIVVLLLSGCMYYHDYREGPSVGQALARPFTFGKFLPTAESPAVRSREFRSGLAPVWLATLASVQSVADRVLLADPPSRVISFRTDETPDRERIYVTVYVRPESPGKTVVQAVPRHWAVVPVVADGLRYQYHAVTPDEVTEIELRIFQEIERRLAKR